MGCRQASPGTPIPRKPTGPYLVARWLLLSLFDLQYNVLLDVLRDLFDVIFFCGAFVEIR